MEWFELIVSFLALTVLEIVLGIDNLILLAVLTERLPAEQRKKARYWGLTFAWVTRLILLGTAVWMTKLTYPVIAVSVVTLSFRDIFLIVGGGFLLVKATQEIHQAILPDRKSIATQADKQALFWSIVLQVGIMDVVFSLDSVLTAIGLTTHFWIMAVAITTAIIIMIFASNPVSRFIEKYPTLKMLALSFLLLIGMVLVADGFSFHIPRAYVYFAMSFSLIVETFNLISQAKSKRRSKKHGLD
jgi:predicted tellurium resistance membrane protein TerC